MNDEPLNEILEDYKVKANHLVHKYSSPSQFYYGADADMPMSAKISAFHLAMRRLEEELEEETIGLLKKTITKKEVDMPALLDNIFGYRCTARLEFIHNNLP